MIVDYQVSARPVCPFRPVSFCMVVKLRVEVSPCLICLVCPLAVIARKGRTGKLMDSVANTHTKLCYDVLC
jgi:hypothetical protein